MHRFIELNYVQPRQALDSDDTKKLLNYLVALGDAGSASDQGREIIKKITEVLDESCDPTAH